MAIKPIFIFAISRSGSTLLQRIIAAHDEVASAGESWLLIPFLYSLRRQGVVAEYVHPTLVTAIEDFCQRLPGGADEYRAELRELMLRLYGRAAQSNVQYVVDKGPYHYIVDDVIDLFPEARFVFLWRNPLAIIASMIETWENGRWYPTMYSGELFTGLPRLVSAYLAHREQSHAVRFEDITSGNDAVWRELMDYLSVGFDPDALHRFTTVAVTGRMGDPTGSKRYSSLTTEPLDKWRHTLVNPLRVGWCVRYLKFLGRERLGVMGYSQSDLIEQVESQPASAAHLLADLARLAIDIGKEPVRVRVRRQGVGGPAVIRELLGS